MFEPSTNVILDCAKWTGTVYCDGIAYSCQVTVPPSRGAETWEGSLSVIKCEKPGGEILIEEKIICNRRFLDEYVIRLLIEGRVGKLAPGKVLTSRMNFLTWTGTGADYFPGTDGRIEKGEDRSFKISVNLEVSLSMPSLVIYSSKGDELCRIPVPLEIEEATYSARVREVALIAFEKFRNMKK